MQNLTSKDNPAVKYAAKLRKSAKFRREEGRFVAEGLRLCQDAMRSGAAIDAVFLTEAALQKNPEVCEALAQYAAKAYTVSPAVFALLGETQTPQGVLCVIKTLDKSAHFDTIKIGGKFLALENVQDPNNLGTVLRSAEAFGVSGVILSADCCDIYNPKVVRGSMGAVFRLPLLIIDDFCSFFAAHPGLHSYAAVVDSRAESVIETRFEEPCIVLIGNEGNGLRAETVLACEHSVTIPMRGKAESLNASAAATILIWEMIR